MIFFSSKSKRIGKPSKTILKSTVARKFRVIEEVWLFPCWGSGGLAAIPLWTLDSLVLLVKLCSTCTMALTRMLIPPAMKSLHGETVLAPLSALDRSLFFVWFGWITPSNVASPRRVEVACNARFYSLQSDLEVPQICARLMLTPKTCGAVTGAAGGIGRELALQFAELGATVICWDKDSRRNNALVDEIRLKDGEGYGYTIDITARDQVISLALLMQRQQTEVSMVVSNAGAVLCAPFSHLRQDSIAKLLEINLLAHFWVIQAFLPTMVERRHGHIIAINSSSGLMPYADMIPYCAAKFGLRGFMDAITEELRLDTWTKNINITSVYLATVATAFYPPPTHRFTSWYSEISAQEAARVIIEGIRKNRKEISIPSFIKFLINLNNLMPYRIRIIFRDFFNFRHRGWFCFC